MPTEAIRQFSVNFTISGNASLSDIFVVVFGCVLGGLVIGFVASRIGRMFK